MIIVSDVAGGFSKMLYITPQGLSFKDRKLHERYDWKSIVNIFPWIRRNVLTVIDGQGAASSGFAFPEKPFRKYSEKMDCVFELWEHHLKQNARPVRFVFPPWCRDKESKLRRNHVFWGLAGGTAIIALAVCALAYNDWSLLPLRDSWPIMAGLFVGLHGLLVGIVNITKLNEKSPSVVSLDGDQVEVVYEDGSSLVRNLKDVRVHTLRKNRYTGTISFRDGSRLEHLERVSYWPMLREQLLSKLEPFIQ